MLVASFIYTLYKDFIAPARYRRSNFSPARLAIAIAVAVAVFLLSFAMAVAVAVAGVLSLNSGRQKIKAVFGRAQDPPAYGR